MKPKALYYKILKYQEPNLQRLQNEFDLKILESPKEDTEELLSDIDVLFAPLGYKVDKEKIDRCKKLKVIASNTTGHPHIDVEYAQQKGIKVACLKFAQDFLKTITPTAELTFGLIIALTRNMIPGHQDVLSGRWDRRPFGAKFMLSRASLGIIGLGRLGSWVAEYALAFKMSISYYDPFVFSEDHRLRRCSSIEELVECSDIVTIHVPHEKGTENLINEQVFRKFKRGSYLVNTSRGELVDWSALLDNLKSGHLAGAASDVFEGEFDQDFSEKFENHPVLEYARNYSNLILTPHIGGSTIDAWSCTEGHTIDMILGFLQTEYK